MLNHDLSTWLFNKHRNLNHTVFVLFLAPTGEVGELDQPTNLLATFIEYASIITHDVRGE